MFSEKNRLIYEYHDGKRQVRADPLRILQRLQSGYPESDMDTDLKLMSLGVDESVKAFVRLAKFTKEVFKVNDVDDGGLLDSEAIVLLVDFTSWCEGVRERFFTLPTSVPPTAPASSTSETKQSPTKPSLPCGSSGTTDSFVIVSQSYTA